MSLILVVGESSLESRQLTYWEGVRYPGWRGRYPKGNFPPGRSYPGREDILLHGHSNSVCSSPNSNKHNDCDSGLSINHIHQVLHGYYVGG